MISIYTSAFNLIKNNFDYKEALFNFSHIANELVIAVNTSEDETLEVLKKEAQDIQRCFVKIVPTDFSYSDPLLDGKIKNAALQASTEEVKIGLDMDERIPLWQKNEWLNYAKFLKHVNGYEAFFIPSINLYQDENHYFSITKKWYMHKAGLFRGAVNFGRKEDGTVDINKSDTCELIDNKGNLVSTLDISLSDLFVYHLGYMNLDDKVLRNKNFWKNHWSIEAGKEVEVPLTVEDISKNRIIKKHNWLHWNHV